MVVSYSHAVTFIVGFVDVSFVIVDFKSATKVKLVSCSQLLVDYEFTIITNYFMTTESIEYYFISFKKFHHFH